MSTVDYCYALQCLYFGYKMSQNLTSLLDHFFLFFTHLITALLLFQT